MHKEIRNKLKNSIFISGMHRSGTSWVSEILSTAGRYVLKDEEMFLPNYPSQTKPIKIWYEYINIKNEKKYTEYIETVLSNEYHLINGLSLSKSINKKVKALYLKVNSILRKSFYHSTPLILVEPLGLLSSDWVSKTYKCKMIIIIRHPAAIISSLKLNNIRYNFNGSHSLLIQNDFLKNNVHFLNNNNENIPEPDDIIGQGILMWKILYGYVQKLQKNNRDWIFAKHEDLSIDPIKEFELIFKKLGLPFRNKTKSKINKLCSKDNSNYLLPGERDKNKRNSKKLIYRWHEILSEDEVLRIQKEVSLISDYWYDQKSWLLSNQD